MTEYQNEQVMNEAAPAAEAFANANEAPAPVAPEKKSNKMLPVIIIAAVALIAILLGILLLGGNGGKYVSRDQGFVRGPEGNIYLNGKKVAQLDYDDVYIYNAYDGKSAVAECKNSDDTGYTVFVVTKKGATELVSEVDVVTYSTNKDYFICRETEGDEVTYTWYDVNKKKSETLGENIASVCLSPDGKMVAYAESEETDEAVVYTTFVKKWGGKATEIELKNATPRLISNGAKYLYLNKNTEDGTDLYRSVNKKEPEKVCSNAEVHNWNVDATEVIYVDDKDNAYWVVGKKEGVKIAKGLGRAVSPINTIDYETFKGQVFTYGDANLGYFDGKEMHKISSKVANAAIAKDGKTLYFTKFNEEGKCELYFVKNATAKKYEPAKVMEDIRSSVTISPDGKKAYVLTEDNELIVCAGKKKGDKIADDVSNIVAMNTKGVCYFEDVDGVLYASKNGKEKVKLADDINGEESGTVGRYGDYFYYKVDGDLFFTTGTKSEKAK